MNNATPRCNSELLHCPESGVRQLDDRASPWTYAGELARYISCASTIRARVLEQYDTSPPIDAIMELQAVRRAERDKFRIAAADVGERPNDYKSFRVRQFGAWPHEGEQVPRPAPEPDPSEEEQGPIVLRHALTPREIIADIERAFRLKPGAITGKRRHKPITLARRTAAYVFSRRHNSSQLIAKWLGGLNHTSVLYAVKQFEASATPQMRNVAARYLGGSA